MNLLHTGAGGKAGQILTSPLLSTQHYPKQLKPTLRQSKRLGSEHCRAPPLMCWVRLSHTPLLSRKEFSPVVGPFPAIEGR